MFQSWTQKDSGVFELQEAPETPSFMTNEISEAKPSETGLGKLEYLDKSLETTSPTPLLSKKISEAWPSMSSFGSFNQRRMTVEFFGSGLVSPIHNQRENMSERSSGEGDFIESLKEYQETIKEMEFIREDKARSAIQSLFATQEARESQQPINFFSFSLISPFKSQEEVIEKRTPFPPHSPDGAMVPKEAKGIQENRKESKGKETNSEESQRIEEERPVSNQKHEENSKRTKRDSKKGKKEVKLCNKEITKSKGRDSSKIESLKEKMELLRLAKEHGAFEQARKNGIKLKIIKRLMQSEKKGKNSSSKALQKKELDLETQNEPKTNSRIPQEGPNQFTKKREIQSKGVLSSIQQSEESPLDQKGGSCFTSKDPRRNEHPRILQSQF